MVKGFKFPLGTGVDPYFSHVSLGKLGESWKANLSQMMTEREQGKQEKGERRLLDLGSYLQNFSQVAMLRKV